MSSIISVIIPFYNARNTLGQAVRSVLTQSLTHLELILVNDGSTDDSIETLSSIQDSRIRIINQQNQGPSAARNNGLRHAKGEWICFVDADDALTSKALERMLYAAGPLVDIIVGCYQTTTDAPADCAQPPASTCISPLRLAKNTLFWQKYEQGIIDDVFAGLPTQHPLNLGAPWAKLYRKAFLNEHHLCFNERLILHEDTLFNHQAYLHAREVRIVTTPVYCYLNNPNSLTRSKNPRYQEHCIAALAQFSQLHPDYPEELCYFAMFRIMECWQGIRSETSHKRSSQLQQLRYFLQNPEIKALVSRMPIKGNLYFNAYDKTELFLLKNKQLFLLVHLMPVIRHLRHLKNRLIRG